MRATLLAVALGTMLAGAATREDLMQADREFCKAVAARGVDGWVDWFAEDGKMFPAGRDVVEGKAAVRELMTARFAQPGFSLRWTPLGAELARSGDFGYTYGKSESRFLDKDGKLVMTEGRYITVWKKGKDGAWKVTADIGSSTPPKPVN
jgi:ketosteroid isomerase-like protein